MIHYLLDRTTMLESDLNDNQINGRSESDHQQATLRGKQTTELVNVERHGKDGVTMIDRTTRFGNKFVLEENGGLYSRERSIEKYRSWFKNKIRKDPDFRKAVDDLAGQKLGCWCKPKSCHGDVILEYLRGKMEIKKKGWRFDEDELTQTKLIDYIDTPPTAQFKAQHGGSDI